MLGMAIYWQKKQVPFLWSITCNGNILADKTSPILMEFILATKEELNKGLKILFKNMMSMV